MLLARAAHGSAVGASSLFVAPLWMPCGSTVRGRRMDVSLDFGHREWGIPYHQAIRGEHRARSPIQ